MLIDSSQKPGLVEGENGCGHLIGSIKDGQELNEKNGRWFY